jgi:hypothetical protein
MDETPECAAVRPLLAEVAAGVADGHERALVLRHVTGCQRCRDELAELGRVADDLLLLLPQREPPAGFEATVLRRISDETAAVQGDTGPLDAVPLGTGPLDAGEDRPPPHRVSGRRPRATGRARLALRAVAAAAALIIAAGAGVGIEHARSATDRAQAQRYRQTVAAGNWQPTTAITNAQGTVVGRMVLYQGAPAWVMVVLEHAPEPGDYAMTVVTADGRRYPAGVCRVDGTSGTTGYPLPVPASQVSAIELSRPGIHLSGQPG